MKIPRAKIAECVHINNNHIRNVLKSSENFFKSRCSTTLKRKLKKYKLRRDGKEDSDVIDVSQKFDCTLRIKYTDNSVCTDTGLQELLPVNYLTKMVRRKNKNNKSAHQELNSETDSVVDVCESSQEEMSSIIKAVLEKKQTNAFALLMDARNKSIGTNSPGKDKQTDEKEIQEVNEKKKVKAKRVLMLQKMAESKGSLKKEEEEKIQEEIIKVKMTQRAERLKNMIMNGEPKKKSNLKKSTKSTLCEVNGTDKKTEKVNKKEKQIIKIIDIFQEFDQAPISPKKTKIAKEDELFLNKLSPSIKKKESMLSYFDKVTKPVSEDLESGVLSDNDESVIKVNLTPKVKKKNKKKKLSLRKSHNESSNKMENKINDKSCIENGTVCLELQDKIPVSLIIPNEKRKRKLKDILNEHVENEIDTNSSRPKRIPKKPVKYNDYSSEDELVIFTPKKKKKSEQCEEVKTIDVSKPKTKLLSKKDCALTKKKEVTTSTSTKVNKKETKVTDMEVQNKPAKLAPIFAKKTIDPVTNEAKQKFLYSGIPEQLKKAVAKQHEKQSEDVCFSTVVHIQQIDIDYFDNETLKGLPDIHNFVDREIESLSFDQDSYKSLVSRIKYVPKDIIVPLIKENPAVVLQRIKKLYPKFPVYRTYHLLKGKSRGQFKDFSYPDLDNSLEVINNITDIKNESPDKLGWIDKFKAVSTNQIIGNFESVKELRKWLVSWKETEDRPKKLDDSDSSDFCHSDTDSKDSMKNSNNLLILHGPVGSGKTSSVYATALELAIKVIEVNASSKRNGKIMLQDLQEATQSHKVNRAKSGSSNENSQKSQEVIVVDEALSKKRGRKKKNSIEVVKKIEIKTEKLSEPMTSQENVRTGMSLILIDDADIIFDQDDGFGSAVAQLVQSSKRPVILVTSSLTCPHLQRFLYGAKVLNMKLFLPRMLGTWLDLMCLAENGLCWPGIGAKLLDYFKGDIRKTINYLHLYSPSCDVSQQLDSHNSDEFKQILDDEDTKMSFSDQENSEKIDSEGTSFSHDKVWKYFLGHRLNLLRPNQNLDLFSVWWSIPRLLDISQECDKRSVSDRPVSLQNQYLSLLQMSKVLENTSLADCICTKKPNFLSRKSNILSKPWFSSELNSVSELENFYDYDSQYEVGNDISSELAISTVMSAQKFFGTTERQFIEYPSTNIQRKKERTLSRHHDITAALNASTILDRRALALDYWSTCRTICRIEKTNIDLNSKRHNRYCHYLKSLKVMCKRDSYDRLCESLKCENDT